MLRPFNSEISLNMNRRDFVVLAALTAFIPGARAGAWESGSFDNDDALDWASQCARSKGASLILTTLNAALVDGYLEAPECSAAIAAAEVVAAANDKAISSLPREVGVWLEQQQRLEIAKLAPLATKAVSRILYGPQSELQELWQENKKDFPAWRNHMLSLIVRLK